MRLCFSGQKIPGPQRRTCDFWPVTNPGSALNTNLTFSSQIGENCGDWT